ncbi:unnamed protein product [Closterium sp. Yama58-4]|nr:unnamed protein product [Closterium sp. Yama58-4]
MRFMVQWASSSAATSPDPRSLFHSSVPEHSTTSDRGNLSFSSRTPLVPTLRRNRSSNASSSPPLVTGTPGASASGAATAVPAVGKSASANARSATAIAAPLLSSSHSFSSRGDDERLPARTRAEPSAAAVAAAPCPHAAPGWGMPCSACLRRALEGGGAVPRSSSAEGRVQQRSGGGEEAGNGARAPEGKAGGRRGEGEGESECAGGRKGSEKGGDGGARNGDRGEPMDQSVKGAANSGSRLAGELELATPSNLRPIKTGVSANAAASLASPPSPPSPPCVPSPPAQAMGLGGSLLGSAKSFARAFSFGAKAGPVTGAGGRVGMPRPRIGPSMSASELISSVPSSTSAALQEKTGTRQEPQRGSSGVLQTAWVESRAMGGRGGTRMGMGGRTGGGEGMGGAMSEGMGRVGVGEGKLGKGEGESGGMGESLMGDARAVGGGEDGGREEGEEGSGKRGSGEEGGGDERGGGKDHGGKGEHGEGKGPREEKDQGVGGEEQQRENGMAGGGGGGGQTGEEEDGEEEDEGERGNGKEGGEAWAWGQTEARAWAWAWAWGEGWEGRVACRSGNSSGPSPGGLVGLGGTRPSMPTPTASRACSVALSGFSPSSPSRRPWLSLPGASTSARGLMPYSPGVAHGTRQGGAQGAHGQGAHGQGAHGQGEEVAAAPFSKRLAYRVDVLFSTHSYVKSLALLTATLVLIAVGGLALYAVSGEERLVLADATWRAWTYVADAGNHADSEGVGPRVVAVAVSIGGMLVFALMVGLVSEGISEKVDSLRKGKSDVIERNHTLILGWSDKLASLLKQLAVANESMGGGVVVVMAERDKEEMESEIAKMEFAFRGTSVICRSGSPLVLADLKKVSVSTARSLIVLAEAENADAADARALRVVLSLTGVREGLRGHIVVELSDLDNEALVKMVGGQQVETVVAHDVIGRLMIQCARQPGLAQIWEALLGFDNCEFYVKHWPQLAGKPFSHVLISFPDAVPCGVRIAGDGGRIWLNPDDDYVLHPDDAVLVVAEDDDSYAPGPLPHVRHAMLPDVVVPPKLPEKILFCGWRRDIDDMIVVLEAFLARGSELWIFCEVPVEEREERLMEGGLNPGDLENVALVHRVGNAVIRRHLESLPLETFDSILILADEGVEDSVINSDSRSLATLLLIRDIQSKRMPYEVCFSGAPARRSPRATRIVPAAAAAAAAATAAFAAGGLGAAATGAGAGAGAGSGADGASGSSGGGGMGGANGNGGSWIRQMQKASQQSIVISEILDSRTRSLVAVSKISDYVLSNELVSMALAMVSEDREINRVLEELFSEEGNEMYIRPAELYLYEGEELSFFEVMVRARQRLEIVIGYRLGGEEVAVLNPPNKSAARQWSLSDAFIVLSLEE